MRGGTGEPLNQVDQTIRTYVARIRSHANEIGRAYSFGIRSGPSTDLWTEEFHVRAVEIERQTVPVVAQGLFARRCAACAVLLRAGQPDPACIEAWEVVTAWLENHASAVASVVDLESVALPAVDDVDPVAPSIIRFDLLAQLTDGDAVERLLTHADRIEAHFVERSRPDLSASQLEILGALARGQSVTEVAHTLGYSRSGLYRELRRTQLVLGVNNRSQALSAADRLGLLTSAT